MFKIVVGVSPTRAATTCTGTPLVSISVIALWRRTCKLPVPIPAAFRSFREPFGQPLRVDRSAELVGEDQVKVLHKRRAAKSRSANWTSRCSRSASTVSASSAIVRRERPRLRRTEADPASGRDELLGDLQAGRRPGRGPAR